MFRVLCLIITTSVYTPLPAFAHVAASGWVYPTACCGGQDCREVSTGVIKTRADGYHLESGEVVSYPDSRVKKSPDEYWHVCTVGGIPSGSMICLFVPPFAF